MIVEADVVTAEHTKSSLYYYTDISGDIPRQISKRIPESYKVIIKYKDITKEYDNVSVYNKCKGKDKVKIQICVLEYKGEKTTTITGVY